MRTTRVAVLVSAAVIGLTGLTACGGDDEKSNAKTDAKALADEAVNLLKQVDDFKMVGSGESDGSKMEMDVCVHKGADLKGTMKMDGSPVEMIKVGKDLYMKADAAFWAKSMGGEGGPVEGMDAMSKLMAGKYMKTPADSDGDNFGDPSDFFDGSTDGVTKGDVVKIDGKKLIPLSKKDKEGATTTLFVPEKGKPYPVLIKKDDDKTELKLSRGKDKCEPAVPPADQIVDADALSKLGES
ncbi:hypothetical protein [Streptomyces sp. SID3343]|uniref:hypothetical protein n=1 Tax=Streptomyces sp. SID3343 TaxID=2690260 RepID=UPI001371F5F4|nr:hypothetical protein [Streptomyces sp. SID3343]MYV99753.1 hypothetical protein [Streptomyces sp. SID3343]